MLKELFGGTQHFGSVRSRRSHGSCFLSYVLLFFSNDFVVITVTRKGLVSYIRSRVHAHRTIYHTKNKYEKIHRSNTRNTIFTYEWKAQFRKWREREIKKYLNLSRCNKWTPSRGKTNSSVYRRLLKVSRMVCQFDKCWTYLCFSIPLILR